MEPTLEPVAAVSGERVIQQHDVAGLPWSEVSVEHLPGRWMAPEGRDEPAARIHRGWAAAIFR